MRVFQGVTGQAGQPWTLAEGLRQIGVEADSWSVAEHKFAYAAHRHLDLPRGTSIDEAYRRIAPLIAEYDVFHFHARSFLTYWPDLSAPSLQDLMLLRLHGKKVYFHFRGQEIRLASAFREHNPFHYADDESAYLFSIMPDASKVLLREAVTALCDGVFVVDEELQTYAPQARVVPRALHARAWDHVGVSDNAVPVIVHAPSRRGVKGTRALLAALDELRAEGVHFELRLVENLANEEAKAVYRSADIIVDQLRIGWYGVLAVEAFALGKPVVAYIRDDLWARHGDRLPVWNANPLTIKERLRELIGDLPARRRLAAAARGYFEQVHSAVTIARMLADIYATETEPRALDGYVALLQHQANLAAPYGGRWTPQALVREFMRITHKHGPLTALRATGHWLEGRRSRRRPRGR